MATAIEFNHVSKQYRLGLVSTRTLSHDLDRWFQTSILRREDPYLKIGEVNDRASKGSSEYVWALRDIDFKVEQGDVVGIIGKNGAGKSTLLKLLSKVTAPTTGTIRARGRIASLLEVGTGFHQEMTGRENIYMNGAILGMTKQEITSKLDEIVAFSGCERYLDTPVKRYSSGMMVRLGFAVAAHLDPEILVVDEVLAVGDAEFQKKAIGKMQDISHGEGRTVLFVSHNMGSIRALCTQGVVLTNGVVSYIGSIGEAVESYLLENAFQGKRLLDTIKVNTAVLTFSDIMVNGNDRNEVFWDNQKERTLHFQIRGCAMMAYRVAFEALIYDEHQNLLASYTPSYNTMELIIIPEGNFIIDETIKFPNNITSGNYYVHWFLTHPRVAYLTQCTEPLKVSVRNVSFRDGSPCVFRSCGFISL